MDQETSFRDSISTVDKKGKRVWIFPKKPSGRFYNLRKIVSYLLLLLLFAGPYLKINGEPFFLINILERKFVIFGQIFWPQDLHIFAIAMVTLVLFVTLFTVVFGRLFCGWICPQTLFMEMLFRRVEYLIEGDWKQQEKLRRDPWTTEKVVKKATKHSIFWFVSFLIANTFLSYVIGYEELWLIVTDHPLNHIGGLISILVFTTIFYLVFSKMREQVCTVVCPYGRLQGVLLDNRSLTVAYDYERGEGRAKFRKGEDRASAGKGDCIDCSQCVHVCPTGIDIRNGTQLECVNCTACIDACDFMMEKVGLEKGLIRYASIDGIEKKHKFQWTPRVIGYCVVLVGLLAVMSAMIGGRSDFEATVLRTRGTLFQQLEDGQYSNIYDITMVNKTNTDFPVELKVLDGAGEIQMIGDSMVLKAQKEAKSKFMILIDEDQLTGRKIDLVVGVYSNGELIQEANTTFIAPML